MGSSGSSSDRLKTALQAQGSIWLGNVRELCDLQDISCIKRGVRIVSGFKPDTGKISKDSLLFSLTDGQRSLTFYPELAAVIAAYGNQESSSALEGFPDSPSLPAMRLHVSVPVAVRKTSREHPAPRGRRLACQRHDGMKTACHPGE